MMFLLIFVQDPTGEWKLNIAWQERKKSHCFQTLCDEVGGVLIFASLLQLSKAHLSSCTGWASPGVRSMTCRKNALMDVSFLSWKVTFESSSFQSGTIYEAEQDRKEINRWVINIPKKKRNFSHLHKNSQHKERLLKPQLEMQNWEWSENNDH